MRTDLHNALEELQASNEEHKASAEEVMSINEELQSSNEELETSKEEMQSLNEELTTVNAQLQAKMEEHQNASNDLSALLSSTDIAVIFLDTEFRIRRFTPAAKAVAHMISTDVGRPLKDLASKFTDPDLLIDARRVLERLTPLDKEITGENLRWYVRRILPYRTVDNRIEGVVLTFVDITERKRAEEVLKKSEDLLTSELHIFAGLYDVTTRVLLASDLSTALQEILSAAIRLLGAQKGDIQLLDKGGDLVRRVASLGFSQKQQLEPSRDGLEAPWRRALVSKQRVVIPDTQDKSRSDSQRLAAIETGFRAVVSTPLRTRRDEVLGVLSTYFTDTHTPSDRELRVLDLFERHASDLIERLRIEEELTRLLRTEQSTRLALDAAAQVKDEFMATLSHELRTPLNVILLWSKALRDAPDLAVKTEAIDAIVRPALYFRSVPAV